MIYRIQLYTDQIRQDGEWHWEDVWCYKDGHFDVGSTQWVRSANSISSLTFSVYPTEQCYKLLDVNSRVRILNAEGWADTGDYYGFSTKFCGRVIEVTPQMDDDGVISKELVCEDALGFLQDSVLYFDSNKSWFDAGNNDYPVDIDGDGVRTIGAEDLIRLIVGQHNSTVSANDKMGDKSWKKLYIGTLDLKDGDGDQLAVDIDPQYDKTGYELLCDVADELGAQFSVTYDEGGNKPCLNVALELGSRGGKFAVGDNIAQSAMETSIADTATRLFPWGDEYAKLKETKPKAVNVKGRLDGTEWKTGDGYHMARYDVSGGLKAHLIVGQRNKDYAMVFFSSKAVTKSNAKKKGVIVRKYTTKAKATGDNIEKWYPVPEDAKYCYVYGPTSSGTRLTLYSNYTKKIDGEERVIKDKYRVGLGFWLKYLRDKDKKAALKKWKLKLGSVTDSSNDKLYYLSANEDKYGVIEGAFDVDRCHLKTEKITQGTSKITSVADLVTVGKTKTKKWREKRARIFFRAACKQASKLCDRSVTITAKVIDMRAGRYEDYPELELFDTWTVFNDKHGLNADAQVTRIACDLREPWDADVEFGGKMARASGVGGSTGGGLASGNMGDISSETDGDDEADEYAALANQYSELATEAAAEAVKSADELDSLSYRIQVDSLAAGQMADSAYDSVHPIVDAMNSALQDAEYRAHELTAVKESQSQTIETSNALARAVATYGYETEESAVRWRKTYTASLDAWASDDEETQAKIQAAYAKLYGEGGTADNPTADSAQGHLIAAKAANVEATAKEAQMRTELASAKAYQESCVSAAQGAQESYDAAKANYDALKKKPTAARKRIDAALAALNGAIAKRDASQAAVDSADARCEEAEENYAAAKAELATAEAKVERAQAEVDTAVNGIHELYSSTIEQTAKGFKLSAEKTDELGKKVGELEVSAEEISSTVSGLESATNLKQTKDGWTWEIRDVSARSTASEASSAAGSAAKTASSAANDAADAKKAASDAAKTATNFMDLTEEGLVVGDKTAQTLGGNTRIGADGIDLRDGTDVLASFDKTNGVSFADGTVFGPHGINGLFYVSGTMKFGATIKAGANSTKLNISLSQLMGSDTAVKNKLINGNYKPIGMIRLSTNQSGVVKLAGFNLNPGTTELSGTALSVAFTRNGTGGTKTINSKSAKYTFTVNVQILWGKCSITELNDSESDTVIDLPDSSGKNDGDADETGTAAKGYMTGSYDSSTGKLTITLD